MAPGPPSRRGFGSRVLQATVRDPLGGQVAKGWPPEGLECRITLPLDRITGREGSVADARVPAD